jgi:hypothetical protein
MDENNWANRDPPTILHCFADYGSESEVLSQIGKVYRVGISPHDTNCSIPIQADAHVTADDKNWSIPFNPDTQFDLGVFHPVCTKWAATTSISGNAEEHENMIPSARAIAEEFCDHHIIENVPKATLNNPTVLNGRMFGLPIEFERAFETSFDVPQPPRERPLFTNEGASETAETSSFFFTERSRLWWATVKGCDAWRYPKQHIAKNTIPRVYIEYLLQAWINTYEEEIGMDEGRVDYSDYDDRMEAERRRKANRNLEQFNSEDTE